MSSSLRILIVAFLVWVLTCGVAIVAVIRTSDSADVRDRRDATRIDTLAGQVQDLAAQVAALNANLDAANAEIASLGGTTIVRSNPPGTGSAPMPPASPPREPAPSTTSTTRPCTVTPLVLICPPG